MGFYSEWPDERGRIYNDHVRALLQDARKSTRVARAFLNDLEKVLVRIDVVAEGLLGRKKGRAGKQPESIQNIMQAFHDQVLRIVEAGPQNLTQAQIRIHHRMGTR